VSLLVIALVVFLATTCLLLLPGVTGSDFLAAGKAGDLFFILALVKTFPPAPWEALIEPGVLSVGEVGEAAEAEAAGDVAEDKVGAMVGWAEGVAVDEAGDASVNGAGGITVGGARSAAEDVACVVGGVAFVGTGTGDVAVDRPWAVGVDGTEGLEVGLAKEAVVVKALLVAVDGSEEAALDWA